MATTAEARTAKFARRRTEILEIACKLINVHGVRGMTLTAVARALGLDTSSVTYYFKRKDQLAAACIEQTLRWQEDAANRAAKAPDPRSRVRTFIHDHFTLLLRQRAPDAAQMALLSDMRSLDDEIRAPLDAIYMGILQTVRGFFGEAQSRDERARTVYATVILMNTIHWLPAWLDRYMGSDLARVEARLFDVLEHGLSPDTAWGARPEPLESADPQDAQERFLHAATNLINDIGYLGASVERIASELGVSTGSFYHHIDNKDDLVVACFNRSFDLVKRARALADAAGGNEGERLAAMLASLVAQQLDGASPMLRHSAYQALPLDLRQVMLNRTGQVTRHFAGRIADGVVEGSLRGVDPVIAGHVVIAALNGASEIRRRSPDRELDSVVAGYCELLRRGIFLG